MRRLTRLESRSGVIGNKPELECIISLRLGTELKLGVEGEEEYGIGNFLCEVY